MTYSIFTKALPSFHVGNVISVNRRFVAKLASKLGLTLKRDDTFVYRFYNGDEFIGFVRVFPNDHGRFYAVSRLHEDDGTFLTFDAALRYALKPLGPVLYVIDEIAA